MQCDNLDFGGRKLQIFQKNLCGTWAQL